METKKSFSPRPRKKVLISNDFREILITQETSIIEQRIITTILSSIKDAQSLFIFQKTPINSSTQKQLSFENYFEDWANQGNVDFIIPLKDLNPNRIMKNLSIKTALINMTNINWLQLKDESISGFRAVPFLLEPSWNRNEIFFKMDKAVIKHLMNMSQYFSLKKDLPYLTSSSNTLRFLMWLLKFKKFGGLTMEYSQILKELCFSKNKYEGRSRFERDFLQSVKADLDSFNDISFNYSFFKGKYSFAIYDTLKSIGKNEKFISLNDLQIDRSIKYLKKKRELNESHCRILKKLFEVRGYQELSSRLKNKIQSDLTGENYIKAIFSLLENQT